MQTSTRQQSNAECKQTSQLAHSEDWNALRCLFEYELHKHLLADKESCAGTLRVQHTVAVGARIAGAWQ
jgi:hypothetical protein